MIPRFTLFTAAAISPGVSGEEILFSLLTLGLLYGVLMVVEVYLLIKYVKAGVVAAMPELVQSHHEGRVQRQVQARCAGVRLLGG